MQKENLTKWPIDEKYGICRLSLISVYQEPRPGAGLLTQILFGETYEVEEATPDRKWLKVKVEADGVVGWMPAAQYEAVSEEAYNFYKDEDFQVVTSPLSSIKFKGDLLYILPGSSLHIGSSELFDMDGTIDFKGNSRHYKDKATGEELVSLAKMFINVPFLSGGRGFFGIGSGSFIQLVYKIGGYKAPKYISQFVEAGKEIDYREIQLGDVLIFGNNKDIPHHAGIYIGDSQVIHVKGKVRVDKVKLDGTKMTKNNSPLYQVLKIRRLMK
ncbi:C40 family peptidase [Echinicola sp. CAU 1574]|uniref:C40 family peptidase n=1 Tax=Echinicola arenosa TaxID=2774144 RepID=A0ABR9AGI4_9BACT|nr:NlpC/P60 family protein [Echinicola arenosa]MBD8487868.1 C40 family peptidase [Echinicola arenosa]